MIVLFPCVPQSVKEPVGALLSEVTCTVAIEK